VDDMTPEQLSNLNERLWVLMLWGWSFSVFWAVLYGNIRRAAKRGGVGY